MSSEKIKVMSTLRVVYVHPNDIVSLGVDIRNPKLFSMFTVGRDRPVLLNRRNFLHLQTCLQNRGYNVPPHSV